MKKILFLNLLVLLIISGCTNFKFISESSTENNSLKNPLIVIPYNTINEETSKLLQKNLSEFCEKKNINAKVYLFEIKPNELKLNEEKNSMLNELFSISIKNNNDGIIFFKYNQYNYGAYGVSFGQELFALKNNSEKIIWNGRGYSSSSAIKKYCDEITNKLISDKVVVNF